MSLRDVLIDELRDLYSAENQLVKALPKTAKGTDSAELKQIFQTHLEETKGHVERLKQVFQMLGKKPTGKHCEGMEGAIKEVKEALEEDEEGALKDTMIIGGAARVEHYEIAGYTVAIAIAKQLGEKEIVATLTETLKEEQNAGKLVLNASKKILKDAAAEEDEDDEEAKAKSPKAKAPKTPKSAKEQESEMKSEQDEQEAAPELEASPALAKKSAKKASKQ
jgi:ferritin-like metal-binding protein YciE